MILPTTGTSRSRATADPVSNRRRGVRRVSARAIRSGRHSCSLGGCLFEDVARMPPDDDLSDEQEQQDEKRRSKEVLDAIGESTVVSEACSPASCAPDVLRSSRRLRCLGVDEQRHD